MRRPIAIAGLLLVGGLLLARQDGATPVREIMGKLNRGPNSLTPTIARDLRDDAPDWEIILDSTKQYVKLSSQLGKSDPPKGEKASWAKLTQAYLADANALDGAARRKDQKAAQAALTRINKSCDACHNAHKKD